MQPDLWERPAEEDAGVLQGGGLPGGGRSGGVDGRAPFTPLFLPSSTGALEAFVG